MLYCQRTNVVSIARYMWIYRSSLKTKDISRLLNLPCLCSVSFDTDQQAVVYAEVWVCSQAIPYAIFCGLNATETSSIRMPRFSCIIMLSSVLHTYIHPQSKPYCLLHCQRRQTKYYSRFQDSASKQMRSALF